MKRTYIDSGVLIAAARGTTPIAIRAMEILDDPDREFASSIFVKLEVLPKAICYKNTAESDFYETFFNAVSYWADSLERIVEDAYREACKSGLAALDALHVAAAISVGAEELVTTEKPDKPIHRATDIKVVSIVPSADLA
ncbi:PIN domain-containing protein [Funiculus sociatus GB2-A5]|uniref:PIN domain-containing protein n=1 Tax=Funiculus sociatus GB2-A5 TaxID=2933946 RepID=A0ABV0JYI8_9CYAN|nr:MULTISPECIES: PIN domain-containing protein [unclassified Trichocoleus]MBD1907478.1 PIN domain-containing protein [Trichocoleus sp. FACHB-832]MBD2063846.1 PIN domain-containing protein [Trichocoleus sp. FACHB-6]